MSHLFEIFNLKNFCKTDSKMELSNCNIFACILDTWKAAFQPACGLALAALLAASEFWSGKGAW